MTEQVKGEKFSQTKIGIGVDLKNNHIQIIITTKDDKVLSTTSLDKSAALTVSDALRQCVGYLTEHSKNADASKDNFIENLKRDNLSPKG